MKAPLTVIAFLLPTIYAFAPNKGAVSRANTIGRHASIQQDPTFTPPDTSSISEQACADAAARMKRVFVPIDRDVSDSGMVGISYIYWEGDRKATRQKLCPVLLVHGFDSSSLEYRRLGPRLAALGVDVYCVDLLGWGYSQLENVKSFSARAKIDALKSFWQTVGNNEQVVIGGASLGGAAVIEVASQDLSFVKGTILIDAQGFVDGIGPMSFLPSQLAKLGIQVLKSTPLRESANQMSYNDPETFATQDALNVGRLHCLRDGWEDGMLSFMQSGGFSPASKVSKIQVPSLILWGRQDGILKGEEFAYKFVESLPDSDLRWVEECGHVPHLEQPDETASLIREFLEKVKPERRGASDLNGVLDGLLSLIKLS